MYSRQDVGNLELSEIILHHIDRNATHSLYSTTLFRALSAGQVSFPSNALSLLELAARPCRQNCWDHRGRLTAGMGT